MKKILQIILLAFLIISCESDSKDDSSNPDDFNRKEMLTFWADGIIVPAYKDFSEKTNSLNEAVASFTAEPSSAKLENARTLWQEAYVLWQKVSLFQIGKAQELNMVGNLNTYPTNVEELEAYILKETYNLESPNLHKVQGFPALDYLLNGFGSNKETVDIYLSGENASKFKKYLEDVTMRINDLATQVYTDWASGYRETFIDNDGYTTTSSVDKLVNFYIVPFYEKQFREYKLAIPAGARTGTPVLSNVEAFYASNLSKEMYITTLNTAKNFFQGVAYDGSKGKSLQQYLEFLNRKDLADDINAKFNTLTTLSNSLDDSFINQIENDRTKMLDTFDAIQAVLKKFKPDMMSAMSVMNTSTDIDND